MKRYFETIRNFFAQYPFITSFAVIAVILWVANAIAGRYGVALQFPEAIRGFLAQHYTYLILSMVFGGLVGASEISSRYRDEPFQAIISLPGRVYILFNATISAFAYFLLEHYRDKIFPGVGTDLLLASVIAGFGAMVVMRSKLFSFKTEGGETFSVGPDAAISTLLTSVDRNIDRYRSFDRQALVFREANRISRPAEAPVFLRTFLASYQNLTDNEKKLLNEAIDKIVARTDLDDQVKLMAISFGFLNISGDANFKALMALLDEFQKSRSQNPNPPPSENT